MDQKRETYFQKRKHQKDEQKKLFIICGILFFITSCLAGMLITSGMFPLFIAKVKVAATNDVTNTTSDKIYSYTTNRESLQTVEISTFPKGFLMEKTIRSDKKVVYLTFDDGPSDNTKDILNILDRYHAKATFFVTGMNLEYAFMIKEEAKRGHTIGLHTMSHDYAKLYASEDAYFEDLEAIGNLVKEQIGYIPRFIRFPGGSSNTVSSSYCKGIMTKLSKDVQEKGYQYYDWNADCEDGSGTLPVNALINNVAKFSENNIILLCHDAIGKETTVKALPGIIQYYQNKGYVFLGIDSNSYVPHHGIRN